MIRGLVAALTLAVASPALAQTSDAEEARLAFERGVNLMEAEYWDQAVVELQRSWDLRPTQVALLNLATCLRQLQRYDEAIARLEEFGRRWGDVATEERRAQVATDLETIRQGTGLARIESTVAGAEVRVDGQLVASTPLQQPIRIAAGTRRIELRHEGYRPTERSADVAVGETVTISFALVRAPVASPAETTPRTTSADRDDRGISSAWFYGVGSASVLALGASAVMGILVWQGDADYRADDGRTAADQEAGKRLARTADLVLLVGIVAGAAAVILYGATDFGGEDRAQTADALVGARF